MAQNDFLVWAGGINANVIPQSAYAALGNLTSGVVTGRASGQQANKTWRQASVMSAMLAKFIVDRTGFDVIDDGTIQTIENNFIAAINSLFGISPTGVIPGAYGPTVSLSVQADGRITSIQNSNLSGTGLTPGTYVAPTITVGPDGRITGIISVAYGPLAGNNTWTGSNAFTNGLLSSGIDAASNGGQLRLANGTYSVILRNDNSNMYFLQTAAGQNTGGFNTLRPFSWNLTTGAVTIDATGVGTSHGGSVGIPNNRAYLGADSGGTGRVMLMYTADNWVQSFAGQAGWRVLNNAGNLQILAIDNSGDVDITGNQIVRGASFFGSTGQFYATQPGPNASLNFANNQYLQFNPTSGFTLNTTGSVTINSPAGLGINGQVNISSSLTAAGRLRAASGAYNSGDVNAAVLLLDFPNSITNPGYQILPNGLIIQWGFTVLNGDPNVPVNFPIAFPNFTLTVVCTEGSAAGGWDFASGVLKPSVHGVSGVNRFGWFHAGAIWSEALGKVWVVANLTTAWLAVGF